MPHRDEPPQAAPASDAWLDALLADTPHLEEGGFTERVLARLPPPGRADAWRRRLVLGGFALGSGLALASPGVRALLAAALSGLTDVGQLTAASGLALTLVLVGVLYEAATA